MEKRNYIIMMYTDKESDFYGTPLRVDSYSESEISRDSILETISTWGDERSRPVLIEDPLMIQLFDAMYRNKTGEFELSSLRRKMRSIAEHINMLAE